MSENIDTNIGKIQAISFFDKVIKKQFKVTISKNYTTIQIGDRYYYFEVETGKYDGTGSDCCIPA